MRRDPDRSEPIRIAMVGGGPDSFIGPVHRRAAELDGRFRLIAGAFSSDPSRSRAAGRGYGLPDERIYPDWRVMLETERLRADGAEAVAIVTPNHLHLPIALAALEAGMHVVSDKPATATLAEALRLETAVAASDRVYALTYTYTGYPMLRMARALVAAGGIGDVRKIVVDYPQGWLAEPIETSGSKQAKWRTDPALAGIGGCIGDIGVHAFQIAEYVSGCRVTAFVADLAAVVPGRRLDDDCNLLLRFENGARGVLIASQIATGELNDLTLRIYGSEASVAWSHRDATMLTIRHRDGRAEIRHAAAGDGHGARLPLGHPEGFIEALANIYGDVARAIRGERALIDTIVPGIGEGVRSMLFVEKAVEASAAGAGWTRLEHNP
jgi:predicted dehydrogenase